MDVNERYQRVDCNECDQEFEIKELLTRRLNDGIEMNYFVCPHCHHEYTSFYTNIEIRSEQKKIQTLYERLRKTVNVNAREKTYQRIMESKEKLGKLMDKLRKSVQ